MYAILVYVESGDDYVEMVIAPFETEAQAIIYANEHVDLNNKSYSISNFQYSK